VITIVPHFCHNVKSGLVIRLLAGLDLRDLASPKTLHQLGLLYEEQGDLKSAHTTLEKLTQNQAAVPASLLNELARVALPRERPGRRTWLSGSCAGTRPRKTQECSSSSAWCAWKKSYLEEAYVSLKKAAQLDPEQRIL